jgi:hypothetical protein
MVASSQLFLILLAVAGPPKPAAPVHKIDVRIAGPLAMVEVWRTVEATPRTVETRQVESTLDLNLPTGAVLVDWEVLEHAEHARLTPQTEGQVSAGLAAVLKMRQLSPSTAPADEGTDYRIHVTPLVEGPTPIVHYRYSVPVACSDGKLQLHMPESLEENPIPAEVTLTLEPHPDGFPLVQASLAGKPAELRSGKGRVVVRGLSPARTAWDISWTYATSGAFPGPVLVAAAPVKKVSGKQDAHVATVALACSGPPSTKTSDATGGVPGSVMLLVDRSRSVGQGGLSEERLMARALIEALPPSVPFNAILFGDTAAPLFPLPRMPTREALEAFSAAADPNRLEKTTDLVAALSRAHAMGATDASSWTVLVTDGALPAGQTSERMLKALSGKTEAHAKIVVLLVRQRGDDGVPGAVLSEYAKLVAKFGGLIRDVPSGSADETARAVIAAMRAGGDWFDLHVGDAKLADVLAAGQSTTSAFVRPGRIQHKVRFAGRGIAGGHISTIHADVGVATVKDEWLGVLTNQVSKDNQRRAFAGATSRVAVAVLPAIPAPRTTDEIVHGRLDETVLRNALSLAFMPRARACYVSRRVATANDAYLRGRIRLELTIERGELHDAVVRKSTLKNPDIETCVRNAAWAVEFPRPEHRDALTVANLNLVFRPHTPEERRPDASPLDREIELILGPLTFTADFSDLLDDKVSEKSAAP